MYTTFRRRTAGFFSGPPQRADAATRGFSLVEFAMVMLFSGMIFAALLSLYVVYSKRVKLEDTYAHIYAANSMMTGAWNLDRRYYCPADPSLPPGDPAYGKENCATSVAAGSCTNGSDGVCVAAGTATPHLSSSDVLIGMFPYATVAEAYEKSKAALELAIASEIDPAKKDSLRRTLEDARKNSLSQASTLSFDGWGNQFTYIVSRALTTSTDERNVTGVIEVVNAALNSDIRQGVHFALISHGVNGKGARNREGRIAIACDDVAVTALERENCDRNGRILRPAVGSFGKTPAEADDIVVYNTYMAEPLWRLVTCDPDNNPATENFCLHNVNKGNVGLGSTDGAIGEKLTIDGQFRTGKLSTGALCDVAGGDCFSPSYIGGNAFNNCAAMPAPPAGKKWVAVQIHNHAIRCELADIPVHNKKCGPNEVATGFDGGGFHCVDPCPSGQQRTQSYSCPEGMTGSGVEYRTVFDCPSRSWTSWQQVKDDCHEPPASPPPEPEPAPVAPPVVPPVTPPPPVAPETAPEEACVAPPVETFHIERAAANETREAGCPSGQTGSHTQTIARKQVGQHVRTWSCPSPTGSPVASGADNWGGYEYVGNWTTASNTCKAAVSNGGYEALEPSCSLETHRDGMSLSEVMGRACQGQPVGTNMGTRHYFEGYQIGCYAEIICR